MMSGSAQVLLVEDNPADVRLVEEALKEGTVSVRLSVVPDGAEAVAFLRRERGYATAPRPDLILLDLNLPRMNGFDVLEHVKADPTLRGIPIVVLTTSQAETDVARSYDLHANCYLVKSSDLDQFFGVMRGLEDFWFRMAQLPTPDSYPPLAS